MSGRNQRLVCSDGFNLLGEGGDTKGGKGKEALLVATREVGLNVRAETTMYTWTNNKVRELIALKVLHNSLLNTTMVAFKLLSLGSYAPMPAASPPFKTILELVLWNDLQSCRYS